MSLRTLKRTFALLLCVAALISPCGVRAQEKAGEPDGLFVVIVNERVGYIDAAGRVRIEPRFEGASDFSEGLAVVSFSGKEYGGYKQGYIDRTGKVVVEPRFDRASAFSGGLAAVGIGTFGLHDSGDHKWGFIDKTGRMVIEPLYRDVLGFGEGLAAVSEDGERWGYVDESGKLVIPFQFDYAASFSEGLACVMKGKKFGFIDRAGKFVIEPKFTSPGTFSEGLALVRVGGKTVEPWPGAMMSGPLGGRLMYIDKTSKPVIKLDRNVESAGPFSEGLAAFEVLKSDGYLYNGYMDRTGRVVIEPRFGHAESFSEGLALILLEGKWGVIDKTGNILFNVEYALARPFRGGLAWVQEGNRDGFSHREAKYGYIDRSGKVVWTPSK